MLLHSARTMQSNVFLEWVQSLQKPVARHVRQEKCGLAFQGSNCVCGFNAWRSYQSYQSPQAQPKIYVRCDGQRSVKFSRPREDSRFENNLHLRYLRSSYPRFRSFLSRISSPGMARP